MPENVVGEDMTIHLSIRQAQREQRLETHIQYSHRSTGIVNDLVCKVEVAVFFRCAGCDTVSRTGRLGRVDIFEEKDEGVDRLQRRQQRRVQRVELADFESFNAEFCQECREL